MAGMAHNHLHTKLVVWLPRMWL